MAALTVERPSTTAGTARIPHRVGWLRAAMECAGGSTVWECPRRPIGSSACKPFLIWL